MTAASRLWGPASLAAVAAILGLVSGLPALGAIAAAIALIPALTARRAAIGAAGERLLVPACALAGAAIAIAVAPPPAPAGGPALAAPWLAAALGALSAATARLYLRAPWRGAAPTFALGLLALAAAGGTRAGPLYAAAVVAHVTLGLLAMRADDRARPPVAALRRPRASVLAIGVLSLAALAGLGAARALPILFEWSNGRLLTVFADTQTGFSDRMWLGGLEGMLQSDAPVLRLHGPRVDHLRGAVYDRYEAGRWSSSRAIETLPEDLPARPPDPSAAVLATRVGGARDRYFLPLGARRIATPDAGPSSDPFGALRSAEGDAGAVWFEPSDDPDPRVAPPAEQDLRVPEGLRAPLEAIAREWTAGAASPEEKIDAIAGRLRADFRYSLDFKRGKKDPVLDFLVDDRRGHCEYFASATALLLRASGVPARVVGGYRVAERSPIGGHHIVREKNAHAWVEAHLPGRGWRTVDTTPEADLPQNAAHSTPLGGALLDLAGALWSRAAASAPPLGSRHIAIGIAAAVAARLLARRIRRRAGRADPGGAAAPPFEPPPPSFARLLEALARRGLPRAPTEPLERFAGRVEAAGLGDAAALVRRHAALRYGGLGDAAALDAAMDGCAERLLGDVPLTRGPASGERLAG